MNRYFGLHILEGEWHSLLPRYLMLSNRAEGRRILDIGCGSGIGASLLLEMGATMVDAIDHRPAVLDLARMKHAKPGLDFHVMFWEELDFPDGTFDTVLCLDPGAPVTDPSLLQEVRRVLKPGGEYVCAIERRQVDGFESLLPRYGYADAAESIDLLHATERPPQVGELQKVFPTNYFMVQRPTLAYRFERAGHHEMEVDDQLQQRDGDEAPVEMWFCGDGIQPPTPREIRLPYFSLVERLAQVTNDLQMRQIGMHHEGEFFDEILDDGPSEVFERERQSTNEYRVVNLDETTNARDELPSDGFSEFDADPPTLVREIPIAPAAIESQLAELSALYHQVRNEFQTVVRDAQTALDERDRYIEHLVGTVQQWQDRYDENALDQVPTGSVDPEDVRETGEIITTDAPAASDAEVASVPEEASDAAEPNADQKASDGEADAPESNDDASPEANADEAASDEEDKSDAAGEEE